MMRTLRRMATLTRFFLLEYGRSGRLVIEALITIGVFYLFFFSVSASEITASYLFEILALFIPLLAAYTASMLGGLVNRPQSALLLVRRVTRGNFLLALFCATELISLVAFGTISLAILASNWPADLTIGGWLAGALPLLLNGAISAAIAILISNLVLSAGWRIAILSFVALALSRNFLTGQLIEALPNLLAQILSALQTIFGSPLVPLLYGYQLSITQTIATPAALANLLAQSSLVISLLSLSIYAFSRRDVVFSA